jgi:hypothetical protein
LDQYKLKLIRKLKVKCSEVNQELETVESFYNQAAPLFCAEVSSYCKDNKIKNPLDDLKDKEKEEEKQELSPDIKSVYRKIAIKTHPDKAGSNDENINLYQDATEAKKKSKIDKIISIAKDLKIDIYNFEYSEIKKIERSIKETEIKISEIMRSYPYVWLFSNSLKRQQIIQRFTLNNV